jgi:hypothetical protein
MNTDYKVVCLPGKKQVYEHRLVWERERGQIPKNHHVHHINGNKRDNRIENLELLSAFDHHSHHFSELAITEKQRKQSAKNVKGAWDKMPMLNLKCVVCGTDFQKRQHLTRGAAKYCSPACRGKDYYANVYREKLLSAGKLKGK